MIAYEKKLNRVKNLVVPAIFTDIQFNVLLKKIKGKKLTQTEKNYLSNAIKSKLNAINHIKYFNLSHLHRKIQFNSIINSYSKAGIELIGYRKKKSNLLNPTEVVKQVLLYHQELDVRIVDLLPVYILKKIKSINLFDIFEFAVENQIINFTGYTFDIVHFYSKNDLVKLFSDSLQERKEHGDFFKDPGYEKIKNVIKQDKIGRRWNVYTLNKLKDYEDYLELYNAR